LKVSENEKTVGKSNSTSLPSIITKNTNLSERQLQVLRDIKLISSSDQNNEVIDLDKNLCDSCITKLKKSDSLRFFFVYYSLILKYII
jgi:hypothetical protein